ncbi:MAG: flagellar assembly protein T N-terminal domain-containing protein [SAR324 cluster bacterium]|nr:flagellar assembly protein T N-terminal domain-containing protein [SAR324 cluster bacterium]
MWKQIVLCIFGLLLFVIPVHANEVIATGSAEIYSGNVGSARNQALQNAQRQAVEQGVGALIDSNTISENFQIIKDEILSSSRGFVTNYEILQEGRTEDGTAYEVKIRADVSDQGIRNKLTALRILHKKMGNKRLMIVYHKRDTKASSRKFQTIPSLLGTLRDEFNTAGFRVFNDRVMDNVYKAIEVATVVDRPTENLIALALDQQAEILVEVELVAGKRGKQGGSFNAIKAEVRLSVYDVSTGRQIADVIGSGKKLSTGRVGAFDIHKDLTTASGTAARKAATGAISKITDYYQSIGDQGFAYLIVLRNYTQDEEDQILDYLESTPGFKDISELKNSPNYLEIELFSSESKSRLRRKIRRDLQQKNIELMAQETSGNRLLFMKPGTENH